MIIEALKTKKYILIGGAAFFLAILAIVAAPLIYRNKQGRAPVVNLSPEEKARQEKIQKEQNRLVDMAKQNNALPSPEEIQKESERIVEGVKQSKDIKSREEIQKDSENLINKFKK